MCLLPIFAECGPVSSRPIVSPGACEWASCEMREMAKVGRFARKRERERAEQKKAEGKKEREKSNSEKERERAEKV